MERSNYQHFVDELWTLMKSVGHNASTIAKSLEGKVQYRDSAVRKWFAQSKADPMPRSVVPQIAKILDFENHEEWKNIHNWQNVQSRFGTISWKSEKPQIAVEESSEQIRKNESGYPESLHHVNIPVRSLQASVAFYSSLLGVDESPSRQEMHFDFPGAWFILPSKQHLHLVVNDKGTFRTIVDAEGKVLPNKKIEPKDCHFALRVANFACIREWVLSQSEEDIPRLIQPFKHKFLQMYILDPDQHVIEINSIHLPNEK